MAKRGIREYDAKRILAKALGDEEPKLVLVGPGRTLKEEAGSHPWLKKDRLVVKPDQLFGKRGKHGLVGVDLDLAAADRWIAERAGKEVTVGGITGTLTHFLVEPFVAHEDEYYVAMRTFMDRDTLYLSAKGGVDVEENWDQVATLDIPVGSELDAGALRSRLADLFGNDRVELFERWVTGLYRVFVAGHFAYLEINPFTVADGKIHMLDAVAKVDDTAEFEARKIWGDLEFPIPFGRSFSPDEQKIADLDARTGASLKLSVLNPDGIIWTMVAGGGASVIYADTISDLGFGHELANYGEYSGNPNTEMTYQYAATILDLMTRNKDAKGRNKVLLIGGGIANFTDVAKTFTGIIQAIREYADKLKETGVEIYVRRGGPNYKTGLERMRALGDELGIPIQVYGPETHMTHIVTLALQNMGGAR